MPWNIGLDGKDFAILNKQSSLIQSPQYNENFLNYFIIKEDGRIGINNINPIAILDIKGDTIANGKLTTSNIIGLPINSTSNVLKLNYSDDSTVNNNLEIYGNSFFKGNITINSNNNTRSFLNINGLLNAIELKGIGSNITNITANNINAGILNTNNGGTGISNIDINEILYGGINKISQKDTFKFIEESDTLEVVNIKSNGKDITNINANNINTGLLRCRNGGTGKTAYNIEGGLLIGNIRAPDNIESIDQTTNLKWDDRNLNLLINGNLKISGQNFIFINDKPLNYSDIGTYQIATSNIAGIIKYDPDFFKLNANNQLQLAQIGSSKWGENEDGKIIYYPKTTTVTNETVGIGFIPNDSDKIYRLGVKGDINIISNGATEPAYRINGINIDERNSNFLSNKIDNIILDNINIQYGGVTKRCFQLVELANNVTAYRIDGNNSKFIFDNNVEFVAGLEIKEGGTFTFNEPMTLKSLKLTSLTGTVDLPVLHVNQQDNTGLKSTIAYFEYRGLPRMLLDKSGNLGIGNFHSDNLPREKLDVVGNIIASGSITHSYSDERLKNFTSNITDSLKIINNLNGYYYEPNEKALEYGFKKEKLIGLSAQEVNKFIPEIIKIAPFDTMKNSEGDNISKSGENYLTICYERMSAVFVEAIKELTKEIKELKNENIIIKKELELLKSCKSSI
jgi:hypothetical protein